MNEELTDKMVLKNYRETTLFATLLKTHGLNGREVAKIIGVTEPTYYNKIKKQPWTMEICKAVKLAKAIDVPIAKLVTLILQDYEKRNKI